MPVLAKAKWEIFAQELANGTDVQKAYVKAGYKPGKGNAYTMKNSREIQNRVTEILSARAAKVEQQYEAEVDTHASVCSACCSGPTMMRWKASAAKALPSQPLSRWPGLPGKSSTGARFARLVPSTA